VGGQVLVDLGEVVIEGRTPKRLAEGGLTGG
jgi:hypothetical protein